MITAAVATQYEAECRFLRAMAHHEALIHFARPYMDGNGNKIGIPWREEAITSGSAVNLLCGEHSPSLQCRHPAAL